MPENNNGWTRTVIIVDDSADIREIFRVMLERHGFGVLEAVDGQAAVELARSKRPDLILMDINMPVLDGLEATRLLRRREGLFQVPIIAVSANPEESHRAAALAAGCNGYVTKPVDFARLGRLVNSLLAA